MSLSPEEQKAKDFALVVAREVIAGLFHDAGRFFRGISAELERKEASEFYRKQAAQSYKRSERNS